MSPGWSGASRLVALRRIGPCRLQCGATFVSARRPLLGLGSRPPHPMENAKASEVDGMPPQVLAGRTSMRSPTSRHARAAVTVGELAGGTPERDARFREGASLASSRCRRSSGSRPPLNDQIELRFECEPRYRTQKRNASVLSSREGSTARGRRTKAMNQGSGSRCEGAASRLRRAWRRCTARVEKGITS